IHVHAALAGYLVGVARRRDLPHAIIERLLALAVTTHGLAACDPRAATTHLALAGLLADAARIVAELEAAWPADGDDDERRRWERDRALLQVAGKARAARRERAWELA